jgi:hypothetical protein
VQIQLVTADEIGYLAVEQFPGSGVRFDDTASTGISQQDSIGQAVHAEIE